jgi:hypothetical protein
VQVLRLLETFSLAEVTAAVGHALRLRAISYDAVKHLVLCALEQCHRNWIWRIIRICRQRRWR